MKFFSLREGVPGFLAAGIAAGIKKNGARDLGLLLSVKPCVAAGVFTKNRVKAAPVLVCKKRLQKGIAQAVLVNSGNANACTGKDGLNAALLTCKEAAHGLGIPEHLVLPCSTGVIGVPLPAMAIKKALPQLIKSASKKGIPDFAEAIMTTDTFPKVEVATCRLKGTMVKVCGMVKGAGMIRPNMATMLSFLVTDGHVKATGLRRMLRQAAEVSYHCITIDGETSTNDTVLLLANGKADHPAIDVMSRDGKTFQAMLSEVCQNLAKNVVKDGEGATKFVEIAVKGARDREDAKKAAYAIAHSPLVKTAFFGEDANWGRILCALGHSGAKVNPDKVDLFFDRAPIVKKGMGVGGHAEMRAGHVFKKKSFQVTVDLHLGKSDFTVFTTDFSFDYVKVNASYRS